MSAAVPKNKKRDLRFEITGQPVITVYRASGATISHPMHIVYYTDNKWYKNDLRWWINRQRVKIREVLVNLGMVANASTIWENNPWMLCHSMHSVSEPYFHRITAKTHPKLPLDNPKSLGSARVGLQTVLSRFCDLVHLLKDSSPN